MGRKLSAWLGWARECTPPVCQKYGLLILHLLATLFVFYLIWHFRQDNPFPNHIDEWRQIDLLRKLIAGNPGALLHMESGFTIFILVLQFFFPIVTSYYIVPIACAMIAAVALWFLFADKRISILSVLLYGALPSSRTILGIWFGVPMVLGLALFLLGLCLLRDDLFDIGSEVSLKSISRFRVLRITAFILLLLVTAAVHPPSAVMLGIIGLLYLRSWVVLAAGVVIGAILVMLVKLLFTMPLIDFVVFKDAILVDYSIYNPVYLSGTIVFLFALVGMAYAVARRKQIALLIGAGICVLDFCILAFSGYSILVPAERNLYLVLAIFALLAAYGAVQLSDSLSNVLRDKNSAVSRQITTYVAHIRQLGWHNNSRKTHNNATRRSAKQSGISSRILRRQTKNVAGWIYAVGCILIVGLLVGNGYSDLYNSYGHPMYTIVNAARYDLFANIASQKRGVILAPFNINNALGPITGMPTLGTVNWNFNLLNDTIRYYNGTCAQKGEFLLHYNVSYVVDLKDPGCPFLSLLDQTLDPPIYYVFVVRPALITH